MKASAISDSMNFLDNEILFTVEKIRNEKTQKHRKTYGILFAAACLALTAVSAIFISSFMNSKIPMLELKVNSGDGMGFEGEFLKSSDDFESDNPWNESGFVCRLPVFSNNSHDEKGTPCALTEKQLETYISNAVSVLGEKVSETKKSYANDLYGGYKKDFVYCITAETESFSVTANAAGGLSIFFNTPVPLPYDFNAESTEDAEKAAEYFASKYSDLISSFIGFEKPKISVSTEYNVYGEIHHTYKVFDSDGSKKEDIVNYNLSFAELRIDNNGALNSIYICDSSDIITEIAHYPIITEASAEKKLISGDFISSVPYDFPGREYISKTDLVYKNERGETVAPYYRFLVELPEAPEVDEMKNYGIFYVPAVKDNYISQITLIDGIIQ
ncbi:MAG: hypothetical protein IJO36_09305 [Clostridia bacterium]|nr:hypothetical protein [Clostridia bacterium]